jgi:hypothetical protein
VEQSAITFLANASAPMALVALYLCLPLSGIKLKPFGVIFAIIFSFFSALIAMLSLFIGGCLCTSHFGQPLVADKVS